MSCSLALLQALEEYDGKSTTILTETANRISAEAGYLTNLVSILHKADDIRQNGITWLLLYHARKGDALSEQNRSLLAKGAIQLSDWQAQLHLCQMIEHIDWQREEAAELALTIKPLLNHKRPFLRAWSMSALHHLGKVNEALTEDAATAVQNGLEDDAASVRARARKLQH